ncbi:mitochondrial proton/calcium exchanger protein-like protein isoform X1 [Tanacetum coccineum]
MKCPQHYLTEMQEVILFYNGLEVPTQQILDSRAIQAQLNNLGREIKKVNEKVYAAQVGCEQCKGPHYTKDCPLKEEGTTLEEAYYTQFGGPFQGGGYRAAALGFYQRNNANPSYQERRQSMEDTLSKFMSESAKRHEENSNLIKEIRASTDAAIRNQGASIKTLEIQIGQMSKVLQERGFGSLPSSTEANPRDQVKSISTTIEVDSYPIRRIGSSQYAVSTGQNRTLMYETRQMTIPFPSRLNGYYCDEKKGSYGPQFSEAYSEASHIDNSIPQKEKDPGSFTLPCFINNVFFDNALVDLGASVSVMPLSTYLNLGLGELAHTKLTVELADKTVKYPKGIAENVLVGIGKFVFPVDFIILDMPEDIKVPLILRRPFLSSDPLNGDYIELNDLNEPFELRRNQGDDLMPTIKEGEVIDEFRTRDDELNTGIDDYPNCYDYPYRLCSQLKFHNSIMKDKMVYKGNNVIGALMNVPIFVGTFSVVTDFAVLEDMNAYRNEGMGKVTFGEPFLREVRVKARLFEGMITIYNELLLNRLYLRLQSNYGDTGELTKGHTLGSLNEDILKITVLTTNMPYPSRKIRRICACTHQRPQRKYDQYAISREDQYAVLEI